MTQTKSRTTSGQPSRKSKWKVGDLFLVPQLDGWSSLGQIVAYEPEALNSVICALYDIRCLGHEGGLPPSELPPSKVVAILFITRDLLDSGSWKVIGNCEPANLQLMRDYEYLREHGFVGVRIIGSGIINSLMNAFYGLTAWDDWAEPDYLDKLLISPDKKPIKVFTMKKL